MALVPLAISGQALVLLRRRLEARVIERSADEPGSAREGRVHDPAVRLDRGIAPTTARPRHSCSKLQATAGAGDARP